MKFRQLALLALAALPAAAIAVAAQPTEPLTALDAAEFAPLPCAHAQAGSATDAALAWDELGFDPFGEGAMDLHACALKIRPGAAMSSPAGCTMNWIVRDAAGQLYIGSAGHCADVGRRVSLSGLGQIGTVAYNGFSAGIDFLLVRIDESKYPLVDPTLCHWGGPSAVGVAPVGEHLLVYGFGTIYGTVSATRGRMGVAMGNSVDTLTYLGTMQPGDSGAPVMTADGLAVGIHVRSSLTAVVVRVDPAPKYATRLDAGLAHAESVLGTDLELVPSTTPVDLLATVGN